MAARHRLPGVLVPQVEILAIPDLNIAVRSLDNTNFSQSHLKKVYL